MLQRRHARHRQYGPDTRENSSMLRIASGIVLVFALILLGWYTLAFFGVGNAVRHPGVVVTVEDLGIVDVSLDGAQSKRADDQMKIYTGDSVITSPRNHASLRFFDGTRVRLDESTEVEILRNDEGEKSSRIAMGVTGTVWISTPESSSYSGSIVRTVETSYLSVEVPPGTEAVLSERSLTVFSAEGLGLSVTMAGSGDPIVIGEGQQFTLPEGEVDTEDLYNFRNALDPNQLLSPFVEESRLRFLAQGGSGATPDPGDADASSGNSTILSVTTPEDNLLTERSTIVVSGSVGPGVVKVRVNGYAAIIGTDRKFSQELALPDEDEISIVIEAVGSDNTVLAEVMRTVKRDRKPPAPPSIEFPVKTGETFRTSETEVEIRGTAPQGTVGIEVNDYRLQLFKPGDREWSYLANVLLDNYTYGENIYRARAINVGGYKSESATITIILGETTDAGSSGSVGSASSTPNNEQVNVPLMPGSISVSEPAPGERYETSDDEFSIIGTVPRESNTVWVNDYRLRFYEAGSTTFKYIASVNLGTMAPGENTYHIVARNAQGSILDSFTYRVTYRPEN